MNVDINVAIDHDWQRMHVMDIFRSTMYDATLIRNINLIAAVAHS